MRIMTSNIWGDYFGNEVTVREDQMYSVYCKYAPDVIGIQEFTSGWYKSSLFEKLHDDYAMIGTEAYDNTNFVPLFVKKKYKLAAKGFEYLTNTPDESKAITWAVLSDSEKNVTFAVCNTHFWWVIGSEHDKIRARNAEQLAALMKYLNEKYDCPVFAFGDMNCILTAEVFSVYEKKGIQHLHDLAELKSDISSYHGDPVRGEDGRFHGCKTSRDYRFSIDHIVALGDGFSTSEYRVIEDKDALDATDHSPVYADVEIG